MRKIIGLFIFSLSLFAEMKHNSDSYMFPDTFMEDNDLMYDKVDVIRDIPKKKEKPKDTMNATLKDAVKATMELINKNSKHKIEPMAPMTLIYIAPTFSKRKTLKTVGVGVGFLINDWLNTELLAETSLKDTKLQLYDITNEYSINILDIWHLRANLLGVFSAGGILDKKTKIEKFFFAYGAGAEVELVINKIKLVGAYKFEVFERKNTKSVKSNIYSVKMKFNFPF